MMIHNQYYTAKLERIRAIRRTREDRSNSLGLEVNTRLLRSGTSLLGRVRVVRANHYALNGALLATASAREKKNATDTDEGPRASAERSSLSCRGYCAALRFASWLVFARSDWLVAVTCARSGPVSWEEKRALKFKKRNRSLALTADDTRSFRDEMLLCNGVMTRMNDRLSRHHVCR